MMEMKALGNAVSKRPVATIVIVLLLTSIFGIYASQMQMSAELNTFLPEDEVVQAQLNISKQFGDTDIMEVIFVGNNTVSKQSLEDMLRVQSALESNESIIDYLSNPDSPGESIISPADAVVMGNVTLEFENSLIRMLRNMSNANNINFTAMMVPISTMNEIMSDYSNIYNNATLIREDAKAVVLMLFFTPEGNGSVDMGEFAPLMENVTLTLLYGENFGVKSRVLTLLTPPMTSGGNESGEMSNPLLHYLIGDMKSSMGMEDKESSVRNFIAAGNFSYLSLNYTNASLQQGMYSNNQTISALNYVNYSVSMGDNSTAIGTLDSMISQLTRNINGMEYVLPYYQDYNRSLSQFLYHLNAGTVSPEDIRSVQENTSRMLGMSTGDFHRMLVIFNSTFTEWTHRAHLYYDVAFEANATQNICQGFIDGYNSAVQMNGTLTYIRGMINHDSTQNTTMMLTSMIHSLQNANENMAQQKMQVEGALRGMKSPYYQWFTHALSDLDYVMQHSVVGAFGVNIFNFAMGMMNNTGGNAGAGGFEVYYALKHAFDSPVADSYKLDIQRIYLNEMKMATMMQNAPKFNMSFETPEFNVPDLNMNASEKMDILRNMTQGDIMNTIQGIENYNSSRLTSAINSSVQVMGNMSENMSHMKSLVDELISGIDFVYRTTGSDDVLNSLRMYENMSATITNATDGLNYFMNHVTYLSGFSYMMEQFSVQFKNMYSKDFDGERAKAALMLVMLNDTKTGNEDSSAHSRKMERIEAEVADAVKRVSVHDKLMFMGTYMIAEATEKTANETMTVILPVAMILIVLILLITFRNIVDTVLGLLGLGMAILWAYGFGVMMNYNFNQISTMVAVLLVGLGIDYAIHSILRYREEIRKGHTVRNAMKEMITHLGMGLVLATLTTMVAFLSNLSSPIPPIQSFGTMNAFGIFGAFIIFTTFVPAVKILIDERRDKKGKLKIREDKNRVGSGVVILNKFMAIGAAGAEKHRYVVLLLILLLTGAALYAGMNVNTTFDIKDFLPSNLEISDTINFMMDNFNSSSMNDNYVLIQGNITSPEVIKAVDKTMNNIEGDDYVNYPQCRSITTLMKEWSEKNVTFAKMLSENDTDGDGYPDQNITAIYNWLYTNGSGNSILHRTENGTYDSMLIVVSSTASTDKENRVLSAEINEDIKPLKDAGYRATLTGNNILTFHIIDLLSGSQWNSLIITVVVSFIVLSIVFFYEIRSYVLGIIASIPVVISLIWLMGSMYALGIGFNVVTVTTTSLTIGLGITYAIHITHRFLEDMRAEKDISVAMRNTVRHTGTSIFGAAATTMAGFGTLMLSTMPPIREFGEISALAILYSFVLSVFILPSFLYTWAEWRERRIITMANRDKIRKVSVLLIASGFFIYFLAFYVRWNGWRIIAFPPSLLVAIAGIVVLIAGGEIYHRTESKL